MAEPHQLSSGDVASLVRVPTHTDDKYSRGVLGFVTGSDQYPGAAVLGVEAAVRTGVGMVRYLGPARPAALVLQRRPEVVTAPGRVQAWVVGSGFAETGLANMGAVETAERAVAAVASGHPIVIDAGAIETDALATAAHGPAIITPHAGELARLLGIDRASVAAEPERVARAAAERFGVVVVLKGHTTWVVPPTGRALVAREAPTWLATAGAGDALAGILGALLATHAGDLADDTDRIVLTRLGAAAAVIHGRAAERASVGGPLTVLDLCAAVSPVIAELLADQPSPRASRA